MILRRIGRLPIALTIIGTVLGACSAVPTQSPGASTTSSAARATALGVPPEVGHVHALGRDPGDGDLLLAGHAGLFRVTRSGFERIGPVIDLMGFTVAGPGHYYASGHPQPGTDLPQPVGLIESRDGGETWSVLSRGGQSDFHSLTATDGGIIGHDGVLRRTDDGTRWTSLAADFEPISLSGRSDDGRVVGSTSTSVVTSDDGGRSWRPVPGSPAPSLVSRADDAAVAITGDGRIHVADAMAEKWSVTDMVARQPMAILASGSRADLEIVVLTEEGLVVSRGGAAMQPWSPSR